MSREALLARTLVELADALVDDFDVVELLTRLTGRCVEVLDVSAAGVLLATPAGDLRVVASSSEEMRLVELFELQSEEGPCPDCFRTGAPVLNQDLLVGAEGRWPRFGPVALKANFRTVHAWPLRLRGKVIGALNLFQAAGDGLGWGAASDARSAEVDVIVGQAMADLATLVVNEQHHDALNSRIMIEQAKGVLAERAGLDMGQAFAWLRDHARDHDLRLADVARSVIAGTVAPVTPDPGMPPGGRDRPRATASAEMPTTTSVDLVQVSRDARCPTALLSGPADRVADLAVALRAEGYETLVATDSASLRAVCALIPVGSLDCWVQLPAGRADGGEAALASARSLLAMEGLARFDAAMTVGPLLAPAATVLLFVPPPGDAQLPSARLAVEDILRVVAAGLHNEFPATRPRVTVHSDERSPSEIAAIARRRGSPPPPSSLAGHAPELGFADWRTEVLALPAW